MADIFDTLDSPTASQGDIFDQLDAPVVKPGDVEGRKALHAKQQKEEAPNQVRERLGNQDTSSLGNFLLDTPRAILSEAVQGVAKAGSGIKRALTGQVAPSTGSTLQDILQNPAVETALGGLQAVASPLAPVSNAISVGAEKANDVLSKLGLKTTADVVSGVGESVANVLAPAKLAEVGARLRPVAAAKYASGRTKAAEAVANAERDLQSLKSGADAAEESILSFTDAAKRQVPKGADIRNALAKDAPTGEAAGNRYKAHYTREFEKQKERFNQEYSDIFNEGKSVGASTEGYQEAFNQVLGEKGISRPLPSRAEKAAGGAKSALALDDEVADQVDALQRQVKSAADPASKKMAQDALDEFLGASEVPQNPTVSDLIKERQRLTAGQRVAAQAKDDNLNRQFTTLIKGLDNDIEAASPGLLDRLSSTNQAYKNEFVPYFGKKAPTRAIAEGEASTVVDSIIKPASNKKAVEIAERSFELIGRDPAQREAVRKAFLNKGIESAFEDGTFKASKFTKWWDSYANPTGNNNKVLKLALGDAYEDAEGIIKTLKTTKPKDFDTFASETVANIKKNTTAKEKEIAGKLKADIEQFMGAPVGKGAGQYLGQMAIFQAAPNLVFGNLGGAAVKIGAGGVMMMTRPAMQRLLEFKRGRSLFKAMARAAPGTVQAAALGRQASQFFTALHKQGGS